MPLLIPPLILLALIYGAIRSFRFLSAQFGLTVALAVAVVAALIILAATLHWLRRRREVAANSADGHWTHELTGAWGALKLSADKRLCEIQIEAAQGAYIFADLQRAVLEPAGDAWFVRLEVRDAARPVWQLPMAGKRQAQQWERIMRLAIEQKLGG
jgi:hypothetical protein